MQFFVVHVTGDVMGHVSPVTAEVWLETLFTAVLASNGVFSKASDTQFIIIFDNDTMVYNIHNIPKIQ